MCFKGRHIWNAQSCSLNMTGHSKQVGKNQKKR
uniref:Uncharacterized protein n=1 Tax=Anguilla anguilla TaxID=7936 RepID=A0A0E9QCA0_ANGAN